LKQKDMSRRGRLRALTKAAMIAALYAGLTALLAPISYGPTLQFRVAEALTILPVFTASAVPGLAIGCALANLYGMLGADPLGVVDIVVGTSATLLAALCTYRLRNIRAGGVPLAAFLSPVLWNALIVGAELHFLVPAGGAFWLAALYVAAGELTVVAALGVPLFLLIQRTPVRGMLEDG